MSHLFVQRLGRITIERGRIYAKMAGIFIRTFNAALQLMFLNRAVFSELTRQLHFVAVQTLPTILFVALVLGSIAVHYLLGLLTGLGAYDEIGKYLTLVMLNELAPIATSLIILLRVVPAVTSEMTLMKINNEVRTLDMLNVGINRYICLPRVLAFGFAGPSLALIFALTGLIGSFLILGYSHDITFDSYLDHLLYGLEFRSLIILLCKPFFMSIGIALVALSHGMTEESTFRLPTALTQGMMESIVMIIFVEIVFLFIL